MKAENLVVNPDDPFGAPPQREYGEPFESHYGQRYHEIRTYLGKNEYNEDKEVLLPVILYVDKTHIDRGGRFTLEPVMFTLSIFTEEARRRVEFWRPLGFISPVDTHRTSAEKMTGSKGQSCRNFHRQLRVILDGLIENQRGNDDLLNNTHRCCSPLRMAKRQTCWSADMATTT